LLVELVNVVRRHFDCYKQVLETLQFSE